MKKVIGIHSMVIQWSFNGHSMVIQWSFDGHSMVIRWSFDGHSMVIRWSFDGKIYKIEIMKLEELQVYNLSMEMAEKIWAIVIEWDYFKKDTIGKQLVRAADSIAANLSEGYGRYHFKENINFSYYSRGSLFETKTWLTKAHNRKLISAETFESFNNEIDNIGVKLNNYIKSIGKKSTTE